MHFVAWLLQCVQALYSQPAQGAEHTASGGAIKALAARSPVIWEQLASLWVVSPPSVCGLGFRPTPFNHALFASSPPFRLLALGVPQPCPAGVPTAGVATLENRKAYHRVSLEGS